MSNSQNVPMKSVISSRSGDDWQAKGWYWPLGIVLVCVLPLGLLGIGIDFSTGGEALSPQLISGLTQAELTEAAHRALHGSFSHTVLEWTAVCAAAFVGFLTFAQFRLTREPSLPVIGVALVCAGAMDAFHTFAADRLIHAVADNGNLIPFTWAICRLFNALILLVGVGVFAFGAKRRFTRHVGTFIAAISAAFVVAAYFVIHICATSTSLPQTMFPLAAIKRPFDIYPLIPYLVCGLVVFPRYFKRHHTLFAYSLMLSIIPQIATQLYMAFGSFQLHDSCFNIAHALKAVSYAVPLVGLMMENVHTYRDRSRAKAMLAGEAEAKLLHQAVAVAAEADSLEDALQQCIDMVCTATGWPVGHVYVPADDGTDDLAPTKIWHLDNAEAYRNFRTVTEQTRFPPGIGLPGRVLKSGQPAWIENVHQDGSFPRAQVCAQIEVKGAVAFPINISGRTVAVLEFFSDDVVQADERLSKLMGSMGEQVGRVLERKQAEQTIAANEARLNAILASTLDPMITINGDGIVQTASDSVQTVFGWKSEELIGQNIKMLMPEPYRSEHDGYISSYRNTGDSKLLGESRELAACRKDGSTFPCEVTLWKVDLPDQSEPLFMGVIRDITERKRSESELRRFRAALDCSADAVFLIDRTTMRFIDMNETACQSIGYSRDELLDMGPQDIKPYNSEKELAEKFDEVIAAEHKVGIIETVHARKDRTLFPTEVFLRALKTEQGMILIATARDITERKENEQRMQEQMQQTERLNLDLEVSKAYLERTVQQLDKTNEELIRKNTELDEFTYVASHDLQEPVRKLVSFSTLLKKDAGEALPERAEKDLDFITDAAKRMQTLVLDLLALSRAGRSAMKHERVSLTECVDRAIDALAVRVEETGAEITRDELPEIDGDRTMLTQLYQNLIGNALKFIDADQPQVHLTAEFDEEQWVLGVRDNGIGINPEYAEQIFAPFKRLHGRGDYEGTGIGLSICRKTVERHGGNIWVESQPGEGAYFKFSIPKNTESEECKSETKTENQPSFS